MFFRAPDLTPRSRCWEPRDGSWAWPEPVYAFALAICVPGFLAVDLAEELHPDDGNAVADQRFWQKIALATAVVGFVLMRPIGTAPFIYFQF